MQFFQFWITALLATIVEGAAAKVLDVVQYGAFTQTATYSIANQLGLFKDYNLNVVYNQVPNSTAAYANVLDGTYDILTGTIDNAVNLRFNSNKPVTVLGQLDQGPDLVLASIPSITKVSQLKGKPLIVDSPVSGYAYLLRKVLSSYGLLLENGDYFFQTVGGTNLRYAALTSGALANGSAVYATILTYPFTAEGESLPASKKPSILARVSSVVSPISSSALTTSETTAADYEKQKLLARFIAAMLDANKILHDSRAKKIAVSAIEKQLNVSSSTALLEYAAATNSVSGEVSRNGKFTVNQRGLDNIIAVRKEFGGFTVPASFDFKTATKPGVGQLIDYTIRNEALKYT